jgi:hypothetical protein
MCAFQFIAAMLTALALVPTGAHLFEMPNKIGLPQQQYFIVQQIYRGWALFGTVLIAAIVVNLALAALLRRRGRRFWPSLVAGLLLALTLAIFVGWTYPANQGTANWTIAPAGWQALRRQWEWSHAANAVLTFAALGFAVLPIIRTRD